MKKKAKIRRGSNCYPVVKSNGMAVFSLYIRTKYMDKNGIVECYTCGCKKNYKDIHSGHYHHNDLDFDERNRRPQCAQCNTFNHGRLDVFGEKLTAEEAALIIG
jgi:hypothetical protein